jgi:hypothetical protein
MSTIRRVLLLLATSMGSVAANAVSPVIEFYNVTLNHYFATISAAEAAAIDSGTAGPGWHRTARVFGAYPDAASAPADAVPVCRFYGNVAAGGPNSHFFTAEPAECAAVKNDPGWRFEGIAFHVRIPTGGACPSGTDPVRRNYNRRFAQHDSNHRYGTDPALYDEMAAIGWAAEGIVMCGDASIATPPRAGPLVASGMSTLPAGCEQMTFTGDYYPSAEVEPYIAIDPRAPDHFVGVWQQDRWQNGGSRGLVSAVSFDAGRTWQRSAAAFSRCTGGNAANGGDYWRASDPWVTFSPDGTVYQIAIAFGGGPAQVAGVNDVAVSRSRDGGVTWETPVVLMRDPGPFFNDKESVTADPTDARYVYAVWDRIDPLEHGPTYFTRTTNGGDSWEAARPIYDPGPNGSTLNNQVVVLPDGTIVNSFTEFPSAPGASPLIAIVRSTDKGVTWSPKILVSGIQTVGTRDPGTGRLLRDGSGLGQITADRQGRLFIVWQDARTTGGARDAVLITSSQDGGLTWSAPARVNANPDAPAFTPSVAVARDGTIGVTYYEFRTGASSPGTLPTDYWLARSTDGGLHWSETRIDGPFDFALAPDANGLFLGDYQGLATVGNAFVPFYGRTNASDLTNRSDIAVAFIP